MDHGASLLDKLEDILIEMGEYNSKEDVREDSLRALLRSKPALKRELAIGLYKKGEISLSRAAEICGVNIEEFKELLRERNIKIPVPDIPSEEINRGLEEILKIS